MFIERHETVTPTSVEERKAAILEIVQGAVRRRNEEKVLLT